MTEANAAVKFEASALNDEAVCAMCTEIFFVGHTDRVKHRDVDRNAVCCPCAHAAGEPCELAV